MTYSSTSQPDILFIFLILYITFHLFSLFPACFWFWFSFVWGFVLFLFAQALCEVNEMLTRTWYFPTCFPTPSSPPPLFFCFFFFLHHPFGFFWDGMQRVGGGDGYFPFAASVQMPGLLPVNYKNASLAGCFKEKRKKKKKENKNVTLSVEVDHGGRRGSAHL